MALTQRYWASPVPEVDDFGVKIEDEFIDGASCVGRWAIFSPRSWLEYGCGSLGTGRGQLYQRDENGRFAKVKG